MTLDWRWWMTLVLILGHHVDEPARGDDEPASLAMSPVIHCLKVEGFRDYVERPDADYTGQEKMLLYYEPSRFAIERLEDEDDGPFYRAHLTQDAQIRRQGDEKPLWRKAKLLDYEAQSPTPPRLIYLINTIAIRDLEPGDYELDITLRDEIGQGLAAKQTVPFRIVARDDDIAAQHR